MMPLSQVNDAATNGLDASIHRECVPALFFLSLAITLAVQQRQRGIKPLLCTSKTEDFAELAGQAKTRYALCPAPGGGKLVRGMALVH